jgi:thiosulfate/3-mercaptopyruvate sulfurtransferase
LEVRDPLVSAEWLKQAISGSNIVVLDATWVPPFLKDRPNGIACYEAGHLPGAAYFDIDEIADAGTALKHMLPAPKVFAERVGALGVSNDDHVIVYDSNGFFASARAWWMFRAMGHDQVSVLDGGLNAWQAAGGSIETSPVVKGAKPFRSHFRSDLVRDLAAMKRHSQAKDVAILDARAQGRFDGTSPEPRPDLPSGHMPGSACVPVTDLIAPDGTLTSRADLARLLKDYANRDVVTSCGSGVSAAVISLALAQLGNWNAAVYDGSWSEWAAQSDAPIEVSL